MVECSTDSTCIFLFYYLFLFVSHTHTYLREGKRKVKNKILNKVKLILVLQVLVVQLSKIVKYRLDLVRT